MKLKRILTSLLASTMVVALAACQSDTQSGGDTAGTTGGTSQEQDTPAQQSSDEPMEIIIISKSFNNQFYQAAFKGAMDAGEEFGVTVTTDGPDAESNIPQQVEKINAAINSRPSAIVLAACDPASVEEAMQKALDNSIPVIGFDSGVPGDPTGAVLATAATDNVNAGANVARNLAQNPAFAEQVSAATADAPVVVGILAQDATSGSISLRVDGFIQEMKAQLESMDGLAGAVEVSGQEKWNEPSSEPAKVQLIVTVPPTTSQADIQSAASAMLGTDNLIAVFGANQDGVNGFLSATADGTELNRETGRYKDLLVVGFDSGLTQRTAISAGEFLGSVTQDPYMMGYEAVRLAVEAAQGNPVSDVDTGSKWYNADNIDNPEIAQLLYD